MIPPHKITGAVAKHCASELAIGYLRYEVLRKLGPGQFNGLHHEVMRTGKDFDALVDELIEKEGK